MQESVLSTATGDRKAAAKLAASADAMATATKTLTDSITKFTTIVSRAGSGGWRGTSTGGFSGSSGSGGAPGGGPGGGGPPGGGGGGPGSPPGGDDPSRFNNFLSKIHNQGLLRTVLGNPYGRAAVALIGAGHVINNGLSIPHTGFVIPGQLAALQLGQITGQGRRAGFGHLAHAAGLALSPFDLVSQQMANAIVKGVADEGFKNKFADALSSTVVDVVNRTGLDWQKTVEMSAIAIRRGSSSLEEFNIQMNDLHDVARQTGSSIQVTADNLLKAQQFGQSIAGAPGIQAAGLATKALNQFLPMLNQKQFSGEQLGILQAIQRNAPLGGIAAADFIPRNLPQAAKGTDRIIATMLSTKPPRDSFEKYARFISYYAAPYALEALGTADPTVIAAIFKAHSKRTGILSAVFSKVSEKEAMGTSVKVGMAAGEKEATKDRIKASGRTPLTPPWAMRLLGIPGGNALAKIQSDAATAVGEQILRVHLNKPHIKHTPFGIASFLADPLGSFVHMGPHHKTALTQHEKEVAYKAAVAEAQRQGPRTGVDITISMDPKAIKYLRAAVKRHEASEGVGKYFGTGAMP